MAQAILIGPPGAGKTTIGKALAKRLSLPFRDTDQIIEAELGRKIADIFVEDGEPFFREVEARVVAEQVAEFNGVLSLGGGAVMQPATANLLSPLKSKIIFLDVGIAYAAARVGFNKDRPLLLVNPRAQWAALMEKRRPTYESLAAIHISTDDKKGNQVASEIVEAMERIRNA